MKVLVWPTLLRLPIWGVWGGATRVVTDEVLDGAPVTATADDTTGGVEEDIAWDAGRGVAWGGTAGGVTVLCWPPDLLRAKGSCWGVRFSCCLFSCDRLSCCLDGLLCLCCGVELTDDGKLPSIIWWDATFCWCNGVFGWCCGVFCGCCGVFCWCNGVHGCDDGAFWWGGVLEKKVPSCKNFFYLEKVKINCNIRSNITNILIYLISYILLLYYL